MISPVKHARSSFVLQVVVVVVAAAVDWSELGRRCMRLLGIVVKLALRNCGQQEKVYGCAVALEDL